MTVQNFVMNRMNNFGEKRKWLFWPFLAMFLTFQSFDFDALAHAEAPLGVE